MNKASIEVIFTPRDLKNQFRPDWTLEECETWMEKNCNELQGYLKGNLLMTMRSRLAWHDAFNKVEQRIEQHRKAGN